jgi:hypothetical protein
MNHVTRHEIDMRSSDIMRERWSDLLRADPYYNPNLSRNAPISR